MVAAFFDFEVFEEVDDEVGNIHEEIIAYAEIRIIFWKNLDKFGILIRLLYFNTGGELV